MAENVIIIKMMRGREIGIVVETESEIMIMIIMIGMDIGIGAAIGLETVISLETVIRIGIEGLSIFMIMIKLGMLC